MRFLGELYSYKHIDSSVVFETLYLIIVFGHGTPEVSNPPFRTIAFTHPSKPLLQIHYLTINLIVHAPCSLYTSLLTINT